MKKFTAPLGILSIFAVISTISACSSDDTTPSQPAKNEVSAESSATGNSAANQDGSKDEASPSSSQSKPSDSKDEAKSSSSRVIHQKVEAGEQAYEDPYFSSGIFCWTEGCEAQYSSEAQPAPASSASTGTVSGATMDTPNASGPEDNTEPTIEGNKMIDQRDQKVYAIEQLAGKLWMTENLDYETRSGSYCDAPDSEDGPARNVCETYGRYYTYSAATKACPSGWRLPTVDEIKALNDVVEHEWWSVGGRFILNDGKIEKFGDSEKQGYLWFQDDGTSRSWKVKNFDGDHASEINTGSTTDRAYNVRCVQN